MPKTLIIGHDQNSNTQHSYFTYWCDDGDKWDLFTMLTGLCLLLLGLCCSVLEVGYILYSYSIVCYGVGLWCASGYLFIGILATTLYQYESVPSATLMLATVLCDFVFGIILSIIAISLVSVSCHQVAVLFYGIISICLLVIIISTIHIIFVTRELLKVRRQFYRTNSE
ncbi:unnamed protein product [Trichobilharzia szidati]|nr:unnamed protein product [Trichobilharzia szidati]